MSSFKESPQICLITSLLLTTKAICAEASEYTPKEGWPGVTSKWDQRGPDPIVSRLHVVWLGSGVFPNPISHSLTSFVQISLGRGAGEALWVGEHLTIMEKLTWDGMGRAGVQAQPSRMSLMSQVQGEAILPLDWVSSSASSLHVPLHPCLGFSDKPSLGIPE